MPPLPEPRVSHPHVLLDDDGSPIIAGTRVPVRRLFSWHHQGTAVETLLKRYPQLGPARIFDALSFAYDNLDLITADLDRERALLQREQLAPPGPPQTNKQHALEAKARQIKLPFKG